MMRQTTALFGLALSLSACGGGVAPSQAPPPADGLPSSTHTGAEASYANVDEAEQGLRRAEAELRSALGPSPSAAGAPPKAEPKAPAEPPAGPQPATPPARDAQAQDASSCATACRAFTSMTKAADTICRLAGNADERCTRAQRSLEDARSSLRTCVCVTAP